MISRRLSLSRNGKTETLKGSRDKGHRREIELTLEAMKQGKEAPIPFAELVEVTEATFAIEEAIRTHSAVSLDEANGEKEASITIEKHSPS